MRINLAMAIADTCRNFLQVIRRGIHEGVRFSRRAQHLTGEAEQIDILFALPDNRFYIDIISIKYKLRENHSRFKREFN